MKKFKKIQVSPQTDFESLRLNVASKQHFDLSHVPPEELERTLKAAFAIVKKTKGSILAVSANTSSSQAAVASVINSASHRKQTIVLQEPNPVMMYYRIANEHLEKAYPIRNSIISMSHVDNYSGLVTQYLMEVTQGIVFLVMTMEALFNQGIHNIPEEYVIYSGDKPLTKRDLEWLDFTTKLKSLVPMFTPGDYSQDFPNNYSDLTYLYSLRNDLTHLKPKRKANYSMYEDLNKRLIDFDPHKFSEVVWHYVSTIAPNFFVEEADLQNDLTQQDQ